MAPTFSKKIDRLWHNASLELFTQKFRKKLDKLLDIFIRIELTVFNCVSTKNFDFLSLAENQPGLVKNEQEGI